jgi:hypothetical protein
MSASEDILKRMEGMDNSKPRRPVYDVPEIKFNGNNGTFSRSVYDKSTKTRNDEPLKAPLNFVILKKRRVLSSFSKTKASHFSTEHDGPNDVIGLFKNFNNYTELDKVGVAKVLREENPLLKTKEIAYVLYNKEICKLSIKGSSLSEYYDYQNKLRDEDARSFSVITTVKASEPQDGPKDKYYKLVFSKKENIEDEAALLKIETAMKTVSDKLSEIDAYNTTQFSSATKVPAATVEAVNKVPSTNQPLDTIEYPEEDINPEDIPF